MRRYCQLAGAEAYRVATRTACSHYLRQRVHVIVCAFIYLFLHVHDRQLRNLWTELDEIFFVNIIWKMDEAC